MYGASVKPDDDFESSSFVQSILLHTIPHFEDICFSLSRSCNPSPFLNFIPRTVLAVLSIYLNLRT